MLALVGMLEEDQAVCENVDNTCKFQWCNFGQCNMQPVHREVLSNIEQCNCGNIVLPTKLLCGCGSSVLFLELLFTYCHQIGHKILHVMILI